jgi:uncharacterized membrane protein
MRFYAAGLLGLLAWAAGASMWQPALRGVIAGDAFFGAYLFSSWVTARGATPDSMRKRAEYEDEGVIAIILLTLSAIALCLVAIFALLNDPELPDRISLPLVVVSVALSWFTLHTVAAFHYAHLYYAPDGPRASAKSLQFPGTREPGIWDFVYFSLVIGMTSQVSDVQVTGTAMRRTVTGHSLTSFLFNTTILALAVNIAAGLVR